MRIAWIIMVVFCLITVSVADQITSIGFSNNKKLNDLLQYRLPDWGYSSWMLSMNGNGGYQDKNNQNDESDMESDNTIFSQGLSLAPDYTVYRESDDRVLSVGLRLQTSLNYSKLKDKMNSLQTKDEKNVDQYYGIRAQVEYARYISDKHYLNLSLYNSSSYYDQEEQKSGTTVNKDFGYGVGNWFEIGYGIGKLRNVTPILRAMRFAERVRDLGYDYSFSSEAIQHIAEQFAKHSGYQNIYFRGNKYFWDDLFQGIPSVPQLKPFDYFFLADVLEEPLTNRYEGWKIETGPYYRQNKQSDNYNNRYAGIYLLGKWSRNLDLDHQLSFTLNGNYEFFSKTYRDDVQDTKYLMYANLSGEYLWIVSDRIVWSNQLSFNFDKVKYNTPEDGDYTETYLGIAPSSTLDYFIEDRMVITATVSFSHNQEDYLNGNRSTNSIQYELIYRYYFYNF
ncbi:MAG: hypothetical protein KBA26_02055 [Candidatus Delongbacteria bacterium]|nr:hypothetical protein [Candidatus Delongbacteria bacterium]